MLRVIPQPPRLMLTLIRLVPMLSSCVRMLSVAAVTMFTRIITAPTPMMIPSIVRNDRIFALHML